MGKRCSKQPFCISTIRGSHTGSEAGMTDFLFLEYFFWLNTNVLIRYHQLKQAEGDLFRTVVCEGRNLLTLKSIVL